MNKGLLSAVAAGSFLSSLTSSVINVALPDMARDYRVDPSQAAWFVLSFLLSVTVLLLPAGRVGDLLGHGRTYVTGMSIFGVGSLGCALAPGPGLLIAFRILQGVGSSLVMSSSPALMTLAMPATRRGFALGMMSTATYVGLA
ncbi:MAG TPA: MFS transporter, partial [Polyangiaceae bacterium]|nr:MFS transporter [Polyangiaceae bacterium]